MFLQNRRALSLFLAAVMLLGAVFSASAPQAAADDGAADSTIIVYMVGSDLEYDPVLRQADASATFDIEEMMQSGYDFERSNLLVITGGTVDWCMEDYYPELDIPADEISVLQIRDGGFEIVGSADPVSMGDPETLAMCLDFCYEEYPAESYGLILWDHGGGPMCGYGHDILFDDMLSLRELVQALDDSPFGKDNKLAFLGFDACMMSSVEVAWMLQDYAEYLIASEEVEPGQGWNYYFLPYLDDGPLDGKDVGYQAMQAYAEYYTANPVFPWSRTLSLTCWDLSYCDKLEEEIDALFSLLSEERAEGAYYPLAQIRYSTAVFPARYDDTRWDLIDLGDLAILLSPYYPEETQAILETLDKMAVVSWVNDRREHGMNMYFPLEVPICYLGSSDYPDFVPWREVYEDFGFAPEYTAFMQAFTSCWGQTSGAYRGLKPMPIQQKDHAYSVQLTEEQAAVLRSGDSYLLLEVGDGAYQVFARFMGGALDEENRYSVETDGRIPLLVNEDGEQALPLISYDPSSDVYYLYAALGESEDFSEDEFSVPVSIPIAVGDRDSLVPLDLCSILDEDSNAVGKRECRITDYPYITIPCMITRPAYDSDGSLLPVPLWESENRILTYRTDSGFAFGFAELPEGQEGFFIQLVCYSISDDAICSELIPYTK